MVPGGCGIARHDSSKEFFRQAPSVLFGGDFEAWWMFGDLNFSAMKETQPEELFAAWLTLADSQRDEIDAEFREIFELSCQAKWIFEKVIDSKAVG